MEKLNLLSCGIVLQIFRMLVTTAANGSNSRGSAWVLDVCDPVKKEHAEIRKLAANCYMKNEESITKYIDIGIDYYYASEINEAEKSKSSTFSINF
jgi:hypothetical protein